ncbi:MAG: methyltransferase domain-containing protein [Myxococcales bacterium]|nr:methyltransferase domain-containing protein [Myxococcales bacterium]
MTWQVSPEEWLLDFTALPRGRVRAGEGLDAIDDRLRSMLTMPPPAALIMPVIAARTPPKPPPVPASKPEGEAAIPALETRSEPRAPSQPLRGSEPQRPISGEIGGAPATPPAPRAAEPSRSISGELGASKPAEAQKAVSGEIGLVMPPLASRSHAEPPARPADPSPSRTIEPQPSVVVRSPEPSAPAAAATPAPSAPAEAPRSELDVQLVTTPSATPGDAMVIPTLTRGNFHLDVDADEASALDRLSPVDKEIGIPSDDDGGEDFMSNMAAAAPLVATPKSADSDVHHEVHLDDVIEDVEPETIDTEPEPVARKPSGPLTSAAVPRPPPVDKTPLPEKPPSVVEKPPPEKAPERPPAVAAEPAKSPPKPPEKAADKPADKAPPPPPAEKSADKPSEKSADKPPPAPPPRPPAAPPAPTKQPPAPAAAPPVAPAAQAGRKRGWYDEAFAEHFANITPIDADGSAELDAAFIKKTAELGAGQTLLDVGCGDGRHCFALANLGLMVTGLECSLPQLVRAAQRNESTEAGVTLLQGDMRSLPRDRTYDVVTCLGTTLGYFESEEQNRQCLQEMVEVLRPGGKLVLHMVNRDYLVAVLPCRSWWQGRGCLVLDVADMNYFTNRMRVHRTVVFEDGRQFEHHMYIRTYSLHDLGRMLAGMGMRVLEVSGSRDTRGRFYGATSAEIWLIAQRRDDV